MRVVAVCVKGEWTPGEWPFFTQPWTAPHSSPKLTQKLLPGSVFLHIHWAVSHGCSPKDFTGNLRRNSGGLFDFCLVVHLTQNFLWWWHLLLLTARIIAAQECNYSCSIFTVYAVLAHEDFQTISQSGKGKATCILIPNPAAADCVTEGKVLLGWSWNFRWEQIE